ncbi:hypothetical protein BDV96DRAFT_577318 [Lophiotrema nucula]|uniref:Uncharacterized protein n=1 Tax=Lophiotrema nucula TaxID=690887 RepID=A0A6A5Z3E9_9PLEO|nr:hypothetical protein BDV96DRAFT_577318 [Lophiotrema nucula]
MYPKTPQESAIVWIRRCSRNVTISMSPLLSRFRVKRCGIFSVLNSLMMPESAFRQTVPRTVSSSKALSEHLGIAGSGWSYLGSAIAIVKSGAHSGNSWERNARAALDSSKLMKDGFWRDCDGGRWQRVFPTTTTRTSIACRMSPGALNISLLNRT